MSTFTLADLEKTVENIKEARSLAPTQQQRGERYQMNTKLFFSSASDRWATPQDLYNQLNLEFSFNFDPCPLDGEEDGLSPTCQWQGKRVYCNPPYGPTIGMWLKRGIEEAEIAIFLLPSRTDTKWFHDLVLPHAKEVRFIRGRLKFGESKNSAPFPSMIVVYRKHLE